VFGYDQARWTLGTIRGGCAWLGSISLGGVQQILERLKIVWKRGRSYVHSPDPDYEKKLAKVKLLKGIARSQDDVIVVFLDEMTVERCPTVAQAYEARGHEQARAGLGHASNLLTRIIAGVNARTAQVTYRRATAIRVNQIVGFYQDLVATYPQATCIYVVQDNWPVHTHPDVLAALPPQHYAAWFRRPRSWPTQPSSQAQKRWGHLSLPIQIVPLPTYASWTNPTEKLWRLCRQTVTHLHRYADDLRGLRDALDRFFLQFAHGSDSLLRYVGLCT
jgi:hypothetical protein